MPTWLWLFICIFGACALLAFVMSPPETVVNWVVARFELHPKLSPETTTVAIDGTRLDGEDKQRVIDDFNQAIFITRYYQIPNFSGTPIMIDAKQGKNDIKFRIYTYDNQMDVYKQRGKKVVAYQLRFKKHQLKSSNQEAFS